MAESRRWVAGGYRFTPIADPPALRERLERAAMDADLLGTVLIATEGINLSVFGTEAGVNAFEAALRAEPGLAALFLRRAPDAGRPFRRLKVRLRREIVTLGRGDDPLVREGQSQVGPDRWHALLDDPDVPVIDVRNDYEVAAGSFPGAVDPGTHGFRDFPDWVRDNLDPARTPEVAMFCTGGIRCEKVAAWMRGQGFGRVHELEGGIVRYLAEVPEAESRWQGDCFVFDDRVSVRAGLARGQLETCHGCRRPVDAAARRSPLYEPGVSCPACAPRTTPARVAARRERRRQVALARGRDRDHLAPAPHHRRRAEEGLRPPAADDHHPSPGSGDSLP